MFIEKKMIDALKDYANGLDVRVMDELVDGTTMFERLSTFFPEGTRFLVDVPEEVKAEEPVKDPAEEPVIEQEEPKEKIVASLYQPKGKEQIIRELMEQGFTNQELIKQTGFNPSTVYKVRWMMKKEQGDYPTRS